MAHPYAIMAHPYAIGIDWSSDVEREAIKAKFVKAYAALEELTDAQINELCAPPSVEEPRVGVGGGASAALMFAGAGAP